MSYAVKVTRTMSVEARKVWATISAGGGLEKWMPVITECRLEGTGVGAVRYCALADGVKLKERILEVNHDLRRFRYGFDEHPFPAKKIVSTVEVLERPGNKSEVSWSAEFDCEASHREEIEELFKGAYAQGLEGLENYLR